MVQHEIRQLPFSQAQICAVIKYWIKVRNGKKLDLGRANLMISDERLTYLKNAVENEGEVISVKDLDSLVEHTARHMMDLNISDFSGSKKWKKLDEHNECLEMSPRSKKGEPIPEIAVMHEVLSLDDAETQRIRDKAYATYSELSDHKKIELNVFNEEDYARWIINDFFSLIVKDFKKHYYNEIKNEQTKKTKKHKIKTKISDVNVFGNTHSDNNEYKSGVHHHFFLDNFDPTTKLYLSPKNYANTYQKVMIQLEKKYGIDSKHKYNFITPGIAIGEKRQSANELKKEALESIVSSPKLVDKHEVAKKFAKDNGYELDENNPDSIKRFIQAVEEDVEAKKSYQGALEAEAEKVYEDRKVAVAEIIDNTLKNNNVSYEVLKDKLDKQGIELSFSWEHEKKSSDYFEQKKEVEQIFTFKDKKTGIEFENSNFSGESRKKIKRYGSSFAEKQVLEHQVKKKIEKKDREPFGVQNLEKVLNYNLSLVKGEMFHQMANAEQNCHNKDELKEQIVKIKRESFSKFMEICIHDGIMVNMTKQGHLTYHKINKNRQSKTAKKNSQWYENKKAESEYSAFKYKSSWFNDDLQGKSMKELFELDDETIMRLNLTWVMEAFPERFMQYNIAFLKNQSKTLSEMNRNADAKSYMLLSVEKNYEYRKLSSLSDFDGGFTIYSERTHQATVHFKQAYDDTYDVLFNPFASRDAALDTWTHIQKQVLENIHDPDYGFDFYDKGAEVSDFLRNLYVERAFCPNTEIRDRISVRNGFDGRTEEFMERKLKYTIQKAEESINKAINEGSRKTFNFTNMHGVFILKNEEFNEMAKERYKDFLNRSIVRLEQEGFVDLTIEGVSASRYVKENERGVEELRQSHVRSGFSQNNRFG